MAETSSQRPWDAVDLERRLCHALDVAKRALGCLGGTGYRDRLEPANSIPQGKLAAETAILLLAASAAKNREPVRSRVEALASLLVSYARSDRTLLNICLEPSLAFDYATAHICLERLGYPDAGFDRMLRQSQTAQARFGTERLPHRVLEQEWIAELWTGSRPRGSRAVRESVLNRPLDLLHGTREDLYALTHALMYVSDVHLPPRRLPRSRAAVLAEAEAAMAWRLDEDDDDLAGELLLAWPLTGAPWSAAAYFSFRVLAAREDQCGMLPAPATRLERLKTLAGKEREAYLLATGYHTTYVMGLLCAAALHPGSIPPAAMPLRRNRPGCADRMLEFLDGSHTSPSWRKEFQELSARERDSLADFLLAIALRRNIGARNYDSAAHVLRTGFKLGLSTSPIASQAAELLERVHTFAQITGLRRTVAA